MHILYSAFMQRAMSKRMDESLDGSDAHDGAFESVNISFIFKKQKI